MADGSSRIAAAFETAAAEGRAALMPYLMGAYPDRDSGIEVARAYASAGADLVELGVPYADPLADGPVIHSAATHALENGARYDDTLAAAAAIGAEVPVVLMAYANMILADPAGFVQRAASAHVAGLIVPDLPAEEADVIRAACEHEGLALVPLVAPNTSPERRQRICAAAQGFVYVVSLTGVTGERGALADGLTELVESVREAAPVPAAVGFGVSSAEQAAEVGGLADGVIIGSRLVREIDPADLDGSLERIHGFLADCRSKMTASSAA